MRRQCQFTVKRSAVPPKCAVSDQPQRPPSQHDSMTVWHLGHSRCARTKIGDSVVPQYLQRGGSTLAMSASLANSSTAVFNLPPVALLDCIYRKMITGLTKAIDTKAMNHPLLRSNRIPSKAKRSMKNVQAANSTLTKSILRYFTTTQ